ncbi:MAG: hypothetical protein KAR39_13170 [Thermoplasmata archaeon]|nr:hypothetical protein [Thermoplasmata archaeon]
MYIINIAEEYEDEKGNPDYEGMIGIQVPTNHIAHIKASMFLIGVTIYRIERGSETIYASDLLLEIMQRRTEKMAGK